MTETMFEPGTPVCVRQESMRRGEPLTIEVIGVVVSWEDKPTGAWHVDGKDNKLWLRRLQLRKVDGEISWLIIDDSTHIARIEAATP